MWPAWFPFPRCWLKALLLGLYSIPAILAIAAISQLLRFSIISFINPFSSYADPAVWCWRAITLVIFPIFAYAHIWQFFEGEPSPKLPAWLPALRSLKEGTFLWLTMFTSALITSWLTYPPSFFDKEHSGIICLTIIAYFYQLRFLNRHAKDK